MVQCCVYGCTNKLSQKGISFFKFPHCEKLKKQWIEHLGRKNFVPTIHSRVCSDHFDDSCTLANSVFLNMPEHYKRTQPKFRLKENALPSKKLGRVARETPSRKSTAASKLNQSRLMTDLLRYRNARKPSASASVSVASVTVDYQNFIGELDMDIEGRVVLHIFTVTVCHS